MGALLVSLFNMKWRCYAQAGGVEESKFCLFSVDLPVRCIFSISPRFYFRRHVFCFLPLLTILESSYVESLMRRHRMTLLDSSSKKKKTATKNIQSYKLKK
jgi:hypothetical protein